MTAATAPPVAVTVAEALRMIRDGRFRIPPFQRPFIWTSRQIVPFFESILAGFPTGAISVVEDRAEAGDVHLGPVRISAPADPLALWVIDGVQRLGTLAGALLGPPKTSLAAFRLAYDLESRHIREHAYNDGVPEHLLPLDVIADAGRFSAWLGERSTYHADRAVDTRSKILDYPLTLTRVLGVDPESAAEVFIRLNSAAVALSRLDVINARNPWMGRGSQLGLHAIAERLASLRFGRLPEKLILESLQAITGLPPSITDIQLAPEASADTEKALSATLTWLREDAAIPHLVVWRRHLRLIPVLARFFHLNPQPSVRALILLRRWTWRAMGRMSSVDDVPPWMLQGLDSVDASTLLGAESGQPEPGSYLRIAGEQLALSVLRPSSLATGKRFALTELLEERGLKAFRRLDDGFIISPAEEGPLEDLLRTAMADRPALLATHALDADTLGAFLGGDAAGFTERRRQLLASQFMAIARGWAEWGASDRPAITELLVHDDPTSPESSDDLR